MNAEFSKNWKGSKRPSKQRKYLANAPLHIKKKQLSVNLSKKLRKEIGKRNVPVRKGDKVKVMRGKFRKKEAKVKLILTKYAKIYLEGLQVKKMDGSMVDIPLRPSNIQIIELDMNDKKRFKHKKEITKKEESSITNKEIKEKKNEKTSKNK